MRGSTLTVCLLVCLAHQACVRPELPSAWFVDSLIKIFPDTPAYAHQSETPLFHAARNTRVNVQIALRSPTYFADLYVDALPATGPGFPIESIQVRRTGYVVVNSNTPDTPEQELLRRAPALFPDPLLEDFPITLKPNRTEAVWLTIRIPKDQAPGIYQGTIQLRQGHHVVQKLTYRLKIYPVTLHEIGLSIANLYNLNDRHIQQFFGLSPFSEEWWLFLERFARFLADYHQTTIWVDPVRLAEVQVRNGKLQFDFSRFERYIETFMNAGVQGEIFGSNLLWRERYSGAPLQVRCWLLTPSGPQYTSIPYADPRARQFLEAFLPALHQTLRQRQWIDQYYQGILDEPRADEHGQAFQQMASLIRRLMPGVHLQEPISLRQDIGFARDLDIWIVHLGTISENPEKLEEIRARGSHVWFYTALSPRGRMMNRFIDYSLLKVRLLHWINFRYHFTGYLHWGLNYWTPEPFKDTQPIINQGRTYLPPGDAFITYPDPGRRRFLASIRLEQMAEGIEDYGLLKLLARTRPRLAEELAQRAVSSLEDYIRQPQQFRNLQIQLLEALEDAIEASSP